MLISIFTWCSLVISVVVGQLVSPCPETFTYESRDKDQPDRWYGVVLLKSQEDLEGIWLRIILDRSAELLGNWFGDTSSTDNIEYTIRNPSYRLEAGPPVAVRFFVKYNAASIVPTVSKILLNGKTLCPTTKRVEPQLHISVKNDPEGTQTLSVSPNNPGVIRRPPPSNRETTKRPSNSGLALGNPLNEDEDDDYAFFGGDFAIGTSNKTASRPLSVPSQDISCGTVATQASPLITFGQSTIPGQWPWHVALYYSKGLELVYTCGGTLISENFVLTAAHCITRPRTNQAVNQRNILVYLGKYSLLSFGPEVQDRKVDQIIIHPRYNATLFYNDLALLKLDRPAEITNYVRKCCLWEENDNLQNLIGKLGTVVGWGFDENRKLTTNLMQTKMPVVSSDTCIFSNRNFFSQFIFDKNYCAGFRNGTSVCNGDSGGGMVFPKAGTSGADTVWQLRGIVSVSVALQGEGTCDPSHFMVFTDASKHLSWIKQKINY